jgi:RimJ/RimL family protein N-acetyltransferase
MGNWHEYGGQAFLLAVLFEHGAQWVQLRTDERNGRSAAAIRKLGATDLGLLQEDLVRRDGTRRQSRVFRLDRPRAVSCTSRAQ